MKELAVFVEKVFQEQYDELFPSRKGVSVQPSDLYFYRRGVDGGYCAVLLAQQTMETIHVKALVVAREYRKQGLGSQLLQDLEAEAVNRGVYTVTLSTLSYQAKEFYLQHGYELYSSLKDVPERGLTKHQFIKYLD